MTAGDRTRVASGAPWEKSYGFSRAVRVADRVYVAGTVGRSEDGSIARDAYSQAKRAIEIIANALAEAGSSLDDVVRTRTFVTDIAMFDDVARAHREAFGDVLPAATLVQVSRLVGDYLLEIEADAEVA